MDDIPFDHALPELAHLSVADLFARYPQTIPVFNRHGMACAGCDVSAFETVERALAIYRMDPAPFFVELERVILGQEET